jgi:predicted dehydrogenase
MSDLSRRDFLADSGRFALGATVLPRHVLGGRGFRAPSDTVNIAIVGAGGMGGENAQELGAENIVAVCDVDMGYVGRKVEERTTEKGEPRPQGIKWKEQFTAAKKYADFRKMLEQQKDIDALVIATPDHLHAVIAKAAMQEGKHVYVQKPLTYSVHEARTLARLAKETGVVTQMGNQGHSSDDARLINEWVQSGVIGPVREVYIWTNRPIWPQGIPRPGKPEKPPEATDWGRGAINNRLAGAMAGVYKPPANLDWQLYLGPVRDDIPWHPVYHPFNWRGWTDFGVGALGDMGAHLVDHPYWALDLGYPETIETTSTVWGGSSQNPATYPMAMTVHYQFPRRGLQPPVKMSWFDGGLMPPRPDVLPADVVLNREGGVMFIGERGVLMHETYGRKPTLYPAELMEETKLVPQTMPRIADKHEANWANAIRGEAKASSPFEYATRLTETMLLGIVALRTGQGRTIEYDATNMQVTNIPEANQYLTREYREGWSV